MDRFRSGKQWFAGCMVLLLVGLLCGCSSRWSPTDPRLDQPDPASAVVLERWEIGVSVTGPTTP